jgi:hypothetical protein
LCRAGRAIGVFQMTDEAGGDDKILCIPAGDPRQAHITELDQVNKFETAAIGHFFNTYKDLEPGKSWTARAGSTGSSPSGSSSRRSSGPTATEAGADLRLRSAGVVSVRRPAPL